MLSVISAMLNAYVEFLAAHRETLTSDRNRPRPHVGLYYGRQEITTQEEKRTTRGPQISDKTHGTGQPLTFARPPGTLVNAVARHR